MTYSAEPTGATPCDSPLAGKRILIVGGGGRPLGERAVPAIKRACELGVQTILLDTADSRCAPYAATHIVADPTNTAECHRAIAKFLKKGALDGIVTFLEERAELASRLQQAFGFPGHSVCGSVAARNKHQMRRILRAKGLPSPKFAQIDSRLSAARATRWFPSPAFLKTVDGGGSLVTRRIEDSRLTVAAFDDAMYEINTLVSQEMRDAVLASFADDRVGFLLEEYLAPARRLAEQELGRVTIELLVQDAEIRFFAIADGRCASDTDHRYSTLCFPSRLPEEDVARFRALAEDVVAAFDLSNGPVILDAVMTDTGPQLYEINARIESSLVLPLISACWGIDLVEETLKIAAGIPLTITLDKDAKGVALTHFILADAPARLTCLEYSEATNDDVGCVFTAFKKGGDLVSGPEGAYDVVAVFKLTGDTHDAVAQGLVQALSGLRLELASDGPLPEATAA